LFFFFEVFFFKIVGVPGCFAYAGIGDVAGIDDDVFFVARIESGVAQIGAGGLQAVGG
jgi:hypothetical protein